MKSIQIIEKLQEKIEQTLAPLLSERFSLIDFPNYSNVGDSAIWLGQMAYFKSKKLFPNYVCAQQDEAIPDATIFLSGGGNFGDIWPHIQKFREDTIRKYPDRKIIQLPQSLYFSSPEALKRTAAIINNHPDFTLLVRDHTSLALAREAFRCTLELCPDMAFCLGSINRPVAPSCDKLYLLRTDVERGRDFVAPDNATVVDWLDEDVSHVRTQAILSLPGLGMDAVRKYKRRELLYRKLAQARLRRGVALLASASSVVTDRLHAHILCLLMDIPHAILDNNYGKVFNFHKAWTSDSDITSLHAS